MPSLSCFSAFDRTNPEAVLWAETRAGELVTGVTEASQKAIRSIITRAFEEGIPPKQAAKLLQEVVSLTEIQANALASVRQAILNNPGKIVKVGSKTIKVPPTGMTSDKLDKVLSDYADKLRRNRALSIARTETIAASNEGQLQLWRQAIANGELSKNVKRVWIAAPSERTCPQCVSLDGQEIEFDGSWDGMENPPAHPMCRCTTGLVA